MKVTYTFSTKDDLIKHNKCTGDDRVEKGFIGSDDKHHAYEYDKSDYCWHSHMTNEEWLEKNNRTQLAACQKCSLWEKCRHHEHTIMTESGLNEKLVDDLSNEINKRIKKDFKL